MTATQHIQYTDTERTALVAEGLSMKCPLSEPFSQKPFVQWSLHADHGWLPLYGDLVDGYLITIPTIDDPTLASEMQHRLLRCLVYVPAISSFLPDSTEVDYAVCTRAMMSTAEDAQLMIVENSPKFYKIMVERIVERMTDYCDLKAWTLTKESNYNHVIYDLAMAQDLPVSDTDAMKNLLVELRGFEDDIAGWVYVINDTWAFIDSDSWETLHEGWSV